MLKTLMISVSAAALCATTVVAYAEPSAELIAAAKAEGMLTTIALPHSWCGYGDVIAGFKAKYPEITVNELNPDAGSADEIEAVKANIGNTGDQAPDVLDIGLAFGPAAKAENLLMPYKVSTWDTIPDTAKDPDGYWYGDYYGVLSFVVNKDIVTGDTPADWSDLLKPEYANSVALAGDPRASNQAIFGVHAAGIGTGAAPGAAAGEAGLNFFAELNKGNFVPVIGKAASLAQGSTPIIIAWDYNGLSWKAELDGNPPVEVVVPASGVVAGVYVQAISAHAPHPNAAKLWMEYLYSDEGQLGWLKGFCHPIRFNDLAANGKIPQELLDALPPAESYAKAVFPTLEEQEAAKAPITGNWDAVVGANVE
jgi:putative spermidine/putrescine transport system substrate-binding protein